MKISFVRIICLILTKSTSVPPGYGYCSKAASPQVYPALAGLYGARVPDFQGIFLRGHGAQDFAQENGTTVGITSTLHQSGALGQVQGDAMRNMSGEAGRVFDLPSGLGPNGVFSSNYSGVYGVTSGGAIYTATFDSSRVVPVASENRPANMAVRWMAKALP